MPREATQFDNIEPTPEMLKFFEKLPTKMSEKEKTIAYFMVEGLTKHQIIKRLNLKPSSLQNYLTSIYIRTKKVVKYETLRGKWAEFIAYYKDQQPVDDEIDFPVVDTTKTCEFVDGKVVPLDELELTKNVETPLGIAKARLRIPQPETLIVSSPHIHETEFKNHFVVHSHTTNFELVKLRCKAQLNEACLELGKKVLCADDFTVEFVNAHELQKKLTLLDEILQEASA